MKRLSSIRFGALGLLIACFALSAVIRIGMVGPAVAQQFLDASTEEAPLAGCAPNSEALLAALRDRSTALDAREATLIERMALLELAEAEFTKREAALIAAEERLSATLALADGAAERDLTQLTTIYENVKPKRAAGIFESMEPSFATGILSRMAPTAAAEILTLMDAEKAYAISVLMAARNMNAGGEVPGTE